MGVSHCDSRDLLVTKNKKTVARLFPALLYKSSSVSSDRPKMISYIPKANNASRTATVTPKSMIRFNFSHLQYELYHVFTFAAIFPFAPLDQPTVAVSLVIVYEVNHTRDNLVVLVYQITRQW